MDSGHRSRIGLALAATILAAGAGSVAYRAWYWSDADALYESAMAHISSYAALRPGGTFSLASFPASAPDADVPTYTAHINSRFVREREFGDAPPPGVKRIVAVGDSATFGTGVSEDERFTAVLEGLLLAQQPGCCEVLNGGWVGMNAAKVARGLSTAVLGWQPSVVIVNSGANDIRDPNHPMGMDNGPDVVAAFEERIAGIVRECQARGVPVILWGNTNGDQRYATLGPINAGLRAVAEREGVPYVDLRAVYDAAPATAEEQRWFLENRPWTDFNPVPIGPGANRIELVALHTDWMHPNRFGHARLAAALLPHVQAALDPAGSPH